MSRKSEYEPTTREGKIAEERYYYDRLTLLQQLNPTTQS